MSERDEELSEFERRTRARLRAGAEALDGDTRSRLTQARFAALEAARARRTDTWRAWLPLGGVAAAALAVWLWSGDFLKHGGTPGSAPAQTPFDDLELMVADEQLEMMEEVEFYAWLDIETVNGIG